MQRLAVEPEGAAGYPKVPGKSRCRRGDAAMRHIPIKTRISIAHNENINQGHQTDQTEARDGSAKLVALCPTTRSSAKCRRRRPAESTLCPWKIQHRQNTTQTATIARKASDTILVNTEKKEKSYAAWLWSQRASQGTQKYPKCGRYRRGDAAMRHIPVQTRIPIAHNEKINGDSSDRSN